MWEVIACSLNQAGHSSARVLAGTGDYSAASLGVI